MVLRLGGGAEDRAAQGLSVLLKTEAKKALNAFAFSSSLDIPGIALPCVTIYT